MSKRKRTKQVEFIGTPQTDELGALLHAMTGVSVIRAIEAAGKPEKELALLREVTRNAVDCSVFALPYGLRRK